MIRAVRFDAARNLTWTRRRMWFHLIRSLATALLFVFLGVGTQSLWLQIVLAVAVAIELALAGAFALVVRRRHVKSIDQGETGAAKRHRERSRRHITTWTDPQVHRVSNGKQLSPAAVDYGESRSLTCGAPEPVALVFGFYTAIQARRRRHYVTTT